MSENMSDTGFLNEKNYDVKEINYNNRILLAVRKKKVLFRFENLLKKKYQVSSTADLENIRISNFDLIIVDKFNYKTYESKFEKLRSKKSINFIPILLIKEETGEFDNENTFPELVTEIINLPLVSSILLNRVKILLDFRNYSVRSENKLKYLTFHDELTGLYNRDFLDQYLAKLKLETAVPLSFIVGNIDSLKVINKKYGNIAGDQIIKETANILSNICGEEDKLIRIGGDEFLGIFFNKNSKDIEELLEKIEETVDDDYRRKIKFSIGLGSATRSDSSQEIESIITTAMSNMYLNKLSKKESMKHQIIKSMINTLEAKSYETNAHAERMKELAVKLGKSINLSKREIDELKLVADLHDIGKVAIPESILKKPASLTREEFEIIKKHPEIGYEIIKTVPEMSNVAKAVLSHHERWDGRGYPNQLKGKEIPILARIITIIDAFDVMMNKRAYKEAYSFSYTVSELINCAGSQFDPDLVNNFLENVVKEVSELSV